MPVPVILSDEEARLLHEVLTEFCVNCAIRESFVLWRIDPVETESLKRNFNSAMVKLKAVAAS